MSTTRAYLPWTTSAAGVNNGYPVFDYPITVKYKYEGEDDSAYKVDASVVSASSATAAAGDSVTVTAADGYNVESMYGRVKSPVDIGAYTNTEYDNDSMVTIDGNNSFTMPAFDTTIYVTLKPAEWISALIYDFPTDTEESKTIMLVTGTNTQDVIFDVTIIGDVTYLPEKYMYKGTLLADTYYDGEDYTDDTRSAGVTAEDFGTTYLARASFSVAASDGEAGIVFRPRSESRGEGTKYSWKIGQKWLEEVSE